MQILYNGFTFEPDNVKCEYIFNKYEMTILFSLFPSPSLSVEHFLFVICGFYYE